jgi:epoxyqueuosine reductase
MQKMNRAVVLGMRVSSAVLEEIEEHPTRLYFQHYRTINASLDQAGLRISNLLQANGCQAIPVPASQILDWQKQSAHLSHKKLGVLAGLGWIGRNNLLVNENLGSQFRLVSILTDAPLKAAAPLKKDCADCFACISLCPVKAIKKNPQDFDHQSCFDKLKDFQRQKFVDQYICGICVKACLAKGDC